MTIIQDQVAVRPIRNENDYEATLREIAGLVDAEPGTPDADRLEVLSILAADYEDRHHPIEFPDPIALLEFTMEARGMTAHDLEPFIGNHARVADVLARKKPLSMAMVRRLATGLGLPADVLVQPYRTSPRRPGV